MAWDEERARRLAREGEQALRRLQPEIHGASSSGLSAHIDILITEKRAAYEAQDMERYEASIRAMVHLAWPI